MWVSVLKLISQKPWTRKETKVTNVGDGAVEGRLWPGALRAEEAVHLEVRG